MFFFKRWRPIAILGCLLIFVGLDLAILVRDRHSGVFVDGHEQTRGDVEAARKEIHALMRGELMDLDGSITVRTPIGLELRSIWTEIGAERKRMTEFVASTSMPTAKYFVYDEPHRNETETAELDDYDKAMLGYLDRAIGNFAKLQAIMVEIDGKPFPRMTDGLNRMRRNREDFVGLQRARNEYLDFAIVMRKVPNEEFPDKAKADVEFRRRIDVYNAARERLVEDKVL